MSDQHHRFSIVLGQRMTWPDMLSRSMETEALGFDGLFLVDHFYGLKQLDDPTHEAYTMLAALAPFTSRVRLGVMVCGNTYRNPAFLLKQAMTVDHISGGRVDFGVGAGWVEREHEAYGWEFPSAKERVDRFAEALEIWDLLQAQDRTTFEGEHYTLIDAPFQPKSLQGVRLPVLIGGTGNRMLRLTAKHADIWNTVGTPEEARTASARLDAVCIEVGRDPKSLVRTVSPSINLLESTRAFEEGVNAYHEAGIRDIYLPWPRTEAEVPVLRDVARTILPKLRKSNGATVSNRRFAEIEDAVQSNRARLVELVATLKTTPEWPILDWLIERPDERFDGSALQTALGFERHQDVTRGIARLGGAFAGAEIARPWNEAQRGYLIAPERAVLLRELGAGAIGANR